MPKNTNKTKNTGTNFDLTTDSLISKYFMPFYLTIPTVLYSIQYKNGCLAASNLFHLFTQSIKFYTFHYHVLKNTDVSKR